MPEPNGDVDPQRVPRATVSTLEPRPAGPALLFPREAGYDVRLGGTAAKLLRRRDLIARVVD